MIDLMIADDNIILSEQISCMLTKEKDFRVVNISHNGLQAIMAYNELKPDVLLLDLNMPGLTGLDVLEQISDNKKNVIVISGSDEYRSKLRNVTKVQWIFDKLFNYDKLYDAIRSINYSNNDENMESKVDYILKRLLFDSTLKGTHLFKSAVLIAYKKPTLKLDDIMKKVAIENNIKNGKTIHSTIDKCISATFNKHHNIDIFEELFPDFYGYKPTTKQLIQYILNYLKKNK